MVALTCLQAAGAHQLRKIRMKYLVLLEPSSTTGKIYSSNNDGTTAATDGGVRCPILSCTEINFDSPGYIFVRRGGSQARTQQSLYLPYHSVVHILQHAEDEPNPLGFAPPASKKD